MMRNRLFVFGLFLLGAVWTAGCSNRTAATLGTTPGTRESAVIAVKDLKGAVSGNHHAVMLRGTMIEKCSVAACWFRLRDTTGVVKVDVKSAGFTVNDVPLGAVVTVSGTPVTQGDETYLAATGMQYR